MAHMKELFVLIVSLLLVSCSAEFSSSNRQISRFGTFGNTFGKLLTSQANPRQSVSTSTGAPPSSFLAGRTGLTTRGNSASPINGRPNTSSSAGYLNNSSPSGNKMPVSFIPVPGKTATTNNVNSNSRNNGTNGTNNTSNNHSGSSNTNFGTNNRCTQRSSRDFRPHTQDCSKFRLCTFGRLVDLDCPQGSVFHVRTGSCVPRGSAYDTCTTHSQACPPGVSSKMADPRHCARYFHCGQPAQQLHWENHLHECPYPMLFNGKTLRCEHYSLVDCGSREVPLDPCDYRANSCDGHVSCVPCAVRHPSCRGRRDGINAWAGRRGSPDYVVCSGERVLYRGKCTQGRGRGVQIFDEMSGGCVTLNQKP